MIRKKVKKICNAFQTSDPYELSQAMNILVMYENLGSINGYYNKVLRMKQIHINEKLNEPQKKFTCAHELGHALLHPDSNTPFLLDDTLLSVAKMEKEANLFAAELLIPDEVLIENYTYTTEQLSILLGYDKKLIEMRLESLGKI